jgi:hypothetical protein
MNRATKRRAASVLPVEAVPPLPLVLTTTEMSLLLAFRTMDDRAKRLIFHMAEHQAATWPQVPAARLRLISGGGK